MNRRRWRQRAVVVVSGSPGRGEKRGGGWSKKRQREAQGWVQIGKQEELWCEHVWFGALVCRWFAARGAAGGRPDSAPAARTVQTRENKGGESAVGGGGEKESVWGKQGERWGMKRKREIDSLSQRDIQREASRPLAGGGFVLCAAGGGGSGRKREGRGQTPKVCHRLKREKGVCGGQEGGKTGGVQTSKGREKGGFCKGECAGTAPGDGAAGMRGAERGVEEWTAHGKRTTSDGADQTNAGRAALARAAGCGRFCRRRAQKNGCDKGGVEQGRGAGEGAGAMVPPPSPRASSVFCWCFVVRVRVCVDGWVRAQYIASKNS